MDRHADNIDIVFHLSSKVKSQSFVNDERFRVMVSGRKIISSEEVSSEEVIAVLRCHALCRMPFK